MSDSPAKAAGKPTGCEKAVTMIEFRIGEHSEDFRKLNDESWIDQETALAW